MEEQLINLEMKIAHHEVAIEELQKASFENLKVIEKLEKLIKHLTDRFDTTEGGAAPIGPGNEKPPHY